MTNLRKFLGLPLKEKGLLVEAVGFIFLAKGMLLVIPFKSCLKWIPKIQNEKPIEGELLIQIKFAIARANRLAFWKNECLVKSVAARWLLQRRQIPSKLSFGMRKDEKGKLHAHAWLQVREVEIVNKNDDFLELFLV